MTIYIKYSIFKICHKYKRLFAIKNKKNNKSETIIKITNFAAEKAAH